MPDPSEEVLPQDLPNQTKISEDNDDELDDFINYEQYLVYQKNKNPLEACGDELAKLDAKILALGEVISQIPELMTLMKDWPGPAL